MDEPRRMQEQDPQQQRPYEGEERRQRLQGEYKGDERRKAGAPIGEPDDQATNQEPEADPEQA